MGVAWEDCSVVAELLGMKLFLNEFVAYQGLSEYKQRRLAGTEEWVGSKKRSGRSTRLNSSHLA